MNDRVLYRFVEKCILGLYDISTRRKGCSLRIEKRVFFELPRRGPMTVIVMVAPKA